MPLYEYSCNSCNTVYEQRNKIADRATSTCPHCNSVDTKQQTTTTMVIADGCPGHEMRWEKNSPINIKRMTNEAYGLPD